MTTPTRISRRSLLGLAGASVGTLLLGACSRGGSGGQGGGAGSSTIEWWHIQNTEPLRPLWEQLAKEYQSQHPEVSFKITPIENDTFKPRLATATQSGTAPDLFQSWGGGVLAQQAEAGVVKDITADVQSWISNISEFAMRPYTVDGKIYGVPFDMGMVGFWYNKALFDRAGISEPPTTWEEFLEDVRMLKAAGITPIALAGQAKWPGHFYWSYLALRVGGIDAIQRAFQARSFEGPEFVRAGELLKQLVDLEPFQKGFLNAPFDTPTGEAAVMGNAQAALELQGQWAIEVQKAQSGNDLGDDLGFFPFPTVEGGEGKITDVFGGGNGFAVGKDAPPATTDFLKYFFSLENHRKAVATGAILPVVKGAEDSIKDPRAKLVWETFSKGTGFQLYLDQDFPPALGQQVNDSVAELIAGRKSPREVTQEITQVAKTV